MRRVAVNFKLGFNRLARFFNSRFFVQAQNTNKKEKLIEKKKNIVKWEKNAGNVKKREFSQFFVCADLLGTLESVVVAGHIGHDRSFVRLGGVDQIYIESSRFFFWFFSSSFWINSRSDENCDNATGKKPVQYGILTHQNFPKIFWNSEIKNNANDIDKTRKFFMSICDRPQKSRFSPPQRKKSVSATLKNL